MRDIKEINLYVFVFPYIFELVSVWIWSSGRKRSFTLIWKKQRSSSPSWPLRWMNITPPSNASTILTCGKPWSLIFLLLWPFTFKLKHAVTLLPLCVYVLTHNLFLGYQCYFIGNWSRNIRIVWWLWGRSWAKRWNLYSNRPISREKSWNRKSVGSERMRPSSENTSLWLLRYLSNNNICDVFPKPSTCAWSCWMVQVFLFLINS